MHRTPVESMSDECMSLRVFMIEWLTSTIDLVSRIDIPTSVVLAWSNSKASQSMHTNTTSLSSSLTLPEALSRSMFRKVLSSKRAEPAAVSSGAIFGSTSGSEIR